MSNRINVFYGIAFASVHLLFFSTFFFCIMPRVLYVSVSRWLDGINFFLLFKMLFQFYLSHIHARIPQNEWAHNNLMIVKFIWLIVSFSCWFFPSVGSIFCFDLFWSFVCSKEATSRQIGHYYFSNPNHWHDNFTQYIIYIPKTTIHRHPFDLASLFFMICRQTHT